MAWVKMHRRMSRMDWNGIHAIHICTQTFYTDRKQCFNLGNTREPESYMVSTKNQFIFFWYIRDFSTKVGLESTDAIFIFFPQSKGSFFRRR